ncbi:hypothetical protein LDENG_00211430 [Lucifuga dentata]|nr:hypothetical protein LDENG_00211430 [Lucifuga dentata]
MSTGPYCYLIFCSICLTVALYTVFIIPETRNKTFVEISQMFAPMNGFQEDENAELTSIEGHLKLAMMNTYGSLGHYEEKNLTGGERL